jgi:protein-disulfide isomerase
MLLLFLSQNCATTLHAEEGDTPNVNSEALTSKPKIKLGDEVEVPIGGGGRTLGKAKATLILMEFTDYECPYCVRFHNTTFPELKARFIDKGILRFIVRDLPLDFHPYAFPMARAARCGDAQSAFSKVNSALYLQPFRKLRNDEEAIKQIAKSASIDSDKFQKCFASKNFDDDIKANIASASLINVEGTPTFVLGRISGDKLSGIAIPGAYPTETFVQLIEERLSQK